MKRYKSVKKMVDLIEVARRTMPKPPAEGASLSPMDPEWEDDMTYPQVYYPRLVFNLTGVFLNLWIYAYNYNNYTYNLRLRTLRYLFPFVHVGLFGSLYWEYKTQLLKVNLFDEYVQLRAKELVEQNEFILEHDDVKRFIYWHEDFKETLLRIHRQANNHEPSDFQDSEVILQDFIKRYSNPSDAVPLPWGSRNSFW